MECKWKVSMESKCVIITPAFSHTWTLWSNDSLCIQLHNTEIEKYLRKNMLITQISSNSMHFFILIHIVQALFYVYSICKSECD